MRVLFVDDEPHILDGLRALLRPHRDRWDMVFANGGRAAMDELERSRFDVIVTDMRMPGVDGATLLRHVQAKHPATVRIVLSGHTELETALRTVPVAHQFLFKPCDPVVLESTVVRACDLQVLINDASIRALVGGVRNLPSLPALYLELTRVLESESAGVREIAEVVEQDPAICAKLLQLVNSAFLGLGREIGSVEQAVGYVGVNLLRNLTLVVQVFCSPLSDPTRALWIHRQQRHAMLVGAVARRICSRDRRQSEDAFMAGLLHDVGKLVLLDTHPQAWRELEARVEAEGAPSHALEPSRFGVTHAEVGGYLLGLWGLPYPIVEAVANHHAPRRVRDRSRDILMAVYAADRIVSEQEARLLGRPQCDPLDDEYLDQCGVRAEIPHWRAYAEEQVGASRSEQWLGFPAADAA